MDQYPTNHSDSGYDASFAPMSHTAGNHIEHIGTRGYDQRPQDGGEQGEFGWLNHQIPPE